MSIFWGQEELALWVLRGFISASKYVLILAFQKLLKHEMLLLQAYSA
jgi:hypothetical protein